MSSTFQPGDVVQLTSGGSKMTVRGAGTDDPSFISCLFFDNSRLVIAEIPPQALMKVSETATPQS
jgi:uncharacterized protein YodC (DUF2158 family)